MKIKILFVAFNSIICLLTYANNNDLLWQQIYTAQFAPNDNSFPRLSVIRMMPLVKNISDIPLEYSAAAGIIQFYTRSQTQAAYLFIKGKQAELSDKKLAAVMDAYRQKQKIFDDEQLSEQKKYRIRTQETLTSGEYVELQLYKKSNVLEKAINNFLNMYMLSADVRELSVKLSVIKVLIDNNVPLILKSNNIVYVCLGYFEKNNKTFLILSNSKLVEQMRATSGVDYKKIKDKKFAQRLKDIAAQKAKNGTKVYFTITCIFDLSIARNLNCISIQEWNANANITVILPPHPNRNTIDQFIKDIGN